MNRRTFDILIPLLYALAVVITTFFGNELVVGATATIGAFVVALYFAALRPKSKA